MTGKECDFKREDFCCLQDEYPEIGVCSKMNKDTFVCEAKPEDLEEFCEDCEKPIDECECGFII